MKYNRLSILGLFLLILFTGCEEKWEKHYEDVPETVDMNVWDAIKAQSELSSFVQYMTEMNYDTLFEMNDTYTLFIPDNEAFASYTDTAEVDRAVLNYHISRHFVQSGNIEGERRIQTFAEKFALLNHTAEGIYFDGHPVASESPLYRNGKFFVLENVAFPNPTIFEFFAKKNPVLAEYVLELDSVILDLEKSIPLRINDEGNTVYDTVAEIYNEFEEAYFPIREEFRNRSATVVFPVEGDYNNALEEMVVEMDGIYTDYTDVPLEWQNDILIPYLLERGVFPGLKERVTFETPTKGDTVKMLNVLGDSVIIDYTVGDRIICSNGYVYNYDDFAVPDTLYNGSIRLETESMLRPRGLQWDWKRGDVKVSSDLVLPPQKDFNLDAGNDSIVVVNFPKAYSGKYTIEFTVENLFPREYRMLVRTHQNVGGVYNIYINDELVRTFDYYEYVLARGYLPSVTGNFFRPEKGFNYFDMYINNTAEYGKAKIKFEYVEPGKVLSNGLVIDYFQFFPR